MCSLGNCLLFKKEMKGADVIIESEGCPCSSCWCCIPPTSNVFIPLHPYSRLHSALKTRVAIAQPLSKLEQLVGDTHMHLLMEFTVVLISGNCPFYKFSGRLFEFVIEGQFFTCSTEAQFSICKKWSLSLKKNKELVYLNLNFMSMSFLENNLFSVWSSV